jgi:hypothetical protein
MGRIESRGSSLGALGGLLGLLAVAVLDARVERSLAARAEFQRHHPCPANGQRRGPCPGYVVDHIQALACGGTDTPDNMQWQTTQEAMAKDRWELRKCR